jgi:hypothetical protein
MSLEFHRSFASAILYNCVAPVRNSRVPKVAPGLR